MWTVPLVDKFGHLYWTFDACESFYSRAEIERLHKHFFHPSSRKLYNLVKRSELGQATPNLRQLIDDVTDACTQCKEFLSKPFRFRASIPDDEVVYNHELAIDLVWLNGVSALHVVDTHTSFQNAVFIKDKTPEGLWRSFTECWSTVYLGLPNVLRVDQEASFNSAKFMTLAEAHGITLQFSGVESHNALGKGERYHAPLRRVYQILAKNHPNMSKDLLLRYAIKGVNDTANIDGLVPSLLVFGVVPTFPMSNRQLPGQKARLQAIVDARLEMGSIVAEQRITRALRSKLPPAVHYDISPGDLVLVHREKTKKWVGPYKVHRVEDKRAFITDGKFCRPFSVTQLLPYTAHRRDLELQRLLKGLSELQSAPDIAFTDVFYPSDPRAKTAQCCESIAGEIKGLMERGVFKRVKRKDLPPDANVISTRMVLAVKDVGTESEKFKARLAAHGHKDREKEGRVHNSPTIRPISLRLLLSTAAIKRFKLWATDIIQAFIQSFNLKRNVYIIPPEEFGLPDDEVFQLIKPLYGLCDAGDYWYITLRVFIRDFLGIDNLESDLSLYAQFKNDGELDGMFGTYVDDICNAGNESFEKLSSTFEQRFDTKDRKDDDFHFSGVHIQKHENGTITVDQRAHIDRLQTLQTTCSFEDFRSERHKLAWLTQSRPDVCATANLLSQITADMYTDKHRQILNKVVKHVQDTPDYVLKHHALDENSLRLVVFSDASFANNPDMSTQLGYLVTLTDQSGKSNILHFTSYKSKRVVRSVLAGETHAFADAFDVAFTMRHELRKVIGKEVRLTMLTDSMSLFKVIINSSVLSEKRLMIDISAARQAYETNDIDHIGWIPTKANVANGLTKFGICDTLNSYLRDHLLSTEIRTVINGRYECIPLTSDEFGPSELESRECDHNDTCPNSVQDDPNTIHLVMAGVMADLILY